MKHKINHLESNQLNYCLQLNNHGDSSAVKVWVFGLIFNAIGISNVWFGFTDRSIDSQAHRNPLSMWNQLASIEANCVDPNGSELTANGSLRRPSSKGVSRVFDKLNPPYRFSIISKSIIACYSGFVKCSVVYQRLDFINLRFALQVKGLSMDSDRCSIDGQSIS